MEGCVTATVTAAELAAGRWVLSPALRALLPRVAAPAARGHGDVVAAFAHLFSRLGRRAGLVAAAVPVRLMQPGGRRVATTGLELRLPAGTAAAAATTTSRQSGPRGTAGAAALAALTAALLRWADEAVATALRRRGFPCAGDSPTAAELEAAGLSGLPPEAAAALGLGAPRRPAAALGPGQSSQLLLCACRNATLRLDLRALRVGADPPLTAPATAALAAAAPPELLGLAAGCGTAAFSALPLAVPAVPMADDAPSSGSGAAGGASCLAAAALDASWCRPKVPAAALDAEAPRDVWHGLLLMYIWASAISTYLARSADPAAAARLPSPVAAAVAAVVEAAFRLWLPCAVRVLLSPPLCCAALLVNGDAPVTNDQRRRAARALLLAQQPAALLCALLLADAPPGVVPVNHRPRLRGFAAAFAVAATLAESAAQMRRPEAAPGGDAPPGGFPAAAEPRRSLAPSELRRLLAAHCEGDEAPAAPVYAALSLSAALRG